ncbi:MAG TPA: lysophospholipid acyltransferase family protein [Candidatus Dormibacteraeota bacterium]|jgi:1-acyl-sn-glycerol-3-phosphate acyltransferase
MAPSNRKRATDSIRSAAWQGAASTGLTGSPFGDPPLSSQSAGAASRRRTAKRDSKSIKTAPNGASASGPSGGSRKSAATAKAAGASKAAKAAGAAERSRAGTTHTSGAVRSTREAIRRPPSAHANGGNGSGDTSAALEFFETVAEAEDWRENPSAAFRVGERIVDRIFSGSFEQRDPDLIRENLPLNWLLATLYFRARVDGLENIPDVGPALLVGNHSGGNYIPDSFILGMAFATYFGAERPWFALTHSAAMAAPILGQMLKAFGSIPASRDNADEALRRGACVLVYPGGDIETYRPWWKRNEISLAGRRGFVRTALKNEVPLVPVVNIGSHETGIFISDGQWLCKLLGWDKSLRIKATPIQIGLPWGIWVTDFLPRVLLPAKIEVRVLPEMKFKRTGPAAAADDDYVQECFDEVVHVMQEALDEMAAKRRWPIIG